jgi:hypothetical protein
MNQGSKIVTPPTKWARLSLYELKQFDDDYGIGI